MLKNRLISKNSYFSFGTVVIIMFGEMQSLRLKSLNGVADRLSHLVATGIPLWNRFWVRSPT